MRVLHVYRTYFPDPPGGMQEAIRQICFATAAHGIENTIFTLSPDPSPQRLNLPEAMVMRSRSWAAPASCDLGGPDAFRIFRRLACAADVVHYLYPWPFGDLLRFSAPERPSVMTYVSDIVRQQVLGRIYGTLMWRTLDAMDLVVSNAPNYALQSPVLSQPRLSAKLRQIPLGISENTVCSNTEHAFLKTHSLGKDVPFALFIGALRYYKGLHFLVEAARNIEGKIVIAGVGAQMAELARDAREIGANNVIFVGAVTEPQKTSLLKACRLVVLPSHLRSEAYGMILVEASIFGKPMVSCEIGTGTSYINHDGETGIVVPPKDPAALAQAINLLLDDDGLAARFGRGARARYEEHFSGDRLGSGYAGVFREAVDRYKARRCNG